MSMYYCPMCNKKFFISGNCNAEEKITCEWCGSISSINRLEEYKNLKSDVEDEITVESENDTQIGSANSTEDKILKLLKKQTEQLESIKNMLKFFTVLIVISFFVYFVSALLLAL